MVPVCYVFHDDAIYFPTDRSAKKLKNIGANDKIALAVDEYRDKWYTSKGMMVRGRGVIVEDQEEFDLARKLLTQKYPGQYGIVPIRKRETAIVKILPATINSWQIQ